MTEPANANILQDRGEGVRDPSMPANLDDSRPGPDFLQCPEPEPVPGSEPVSAPAPDLEPAQAPAPEPAPAGSDPAPVPGKARVLAKWATEPAPVVPGPEEYFGSSQSPAYQQRLVEARKEKRKMTRPYIGRKSRSIQRIRAEEWNCRTLVNSDINAIEKCILVFRTTKKRDAFLDWLGEKLTGFCIRHGVNVAVRDGVRISEDSIDMRLTPKPKAPDPVPVAVAVAVTAPVLPELAPGQWPVEAKVRITGVCPNPRLLVGELEDKRRVSVFRGPRGFRSGDLVPCRLTQGGGSPIYTPA